MDHTTASSLSAYKMGKPLVIDSHIHMLPPVVMESFRNWLASTQTFAEGPHHLWSSSAFEEPDQQIDALDEAGIDKALITFSSNAPAAMHATALAHGMNGPQMVRLVNNQIADWAQASHGRLVPTAWIEPRFGADAIAEMERVVHDFDMHAFSLLTAYGGRENQPFRFLDHPDFYPVLAHAAALNIPVYIHASSRFNITETSPALGEPAATYLKGGLSMLLESTLCIARLVVSGVFERLPDLRLVFGQLGGLFPFVLGRFDLIYELVVVTAAKREVEMPLSKKDASTTFRRLREYTGQIYADTHSMDQAAILCALDALGPEHVLFGSDFPVTPTKIGRSSALDAIGSLPVNEDIKAAILGENALKILDGEAPVKGGTT